MRYCTLERQLSTISTVPGRSRSNPCILNHGILQSTMNDIQHKWDQRAPWKMEDMKLSIELEAYYDGENKIIALPDTYM
jgi:hypothetical protein